MTTAEDEVFIGLQYENCYLVRVMNLWWGDKNLVGRSLVGEFFLVQGMSNDPPSKEIPDFRP